MEQFTTLDFRAVAPKAANVNLFLSERGELKTSPWEGARDNGRDYESFTPPILGKEFMTLNIKESFMGGAETRTIVV